jgi:hypothetical protein
MMLYSTYNLIVAGFLLLIITFVATTTASTWILIASGICCVAMLFSLSVLLLPKIYVHYSGREINIFDLIGLDPNQRPANSGAIFPQSQQQNNNNASPNQPGMNSDLVYYESGAVTDANVHAAGGGGGSPVSRATRPAQEGANCFDEDGSSGAITPATGKTASSAGSLRQATMVAPVLVLPRSFYTANNARRGRHATGNEFS